MGRTVQAALAAYAGRVDEARQTAAESMAASLEFGPFLLAGWAQMVIGFLEVSLGNYSAALAALEPFLPMLDAIPGAAEIVMVPCLPDAAEALVHLGRLDEAEALVGTLERNGRRLDRPWMLAVGGRCRAMVLAARGDRDGASIAVQQAMSEHDRLPMPFERARTQLLLGQLLRRQKHKTAASATMHEALSTFEALGTPLWAEKARAALAAPWLALSEPLGSRRRSSGSPNSPRRG